jgi:hypothetical protein
MTTAPIWEYRLERLYVDQNSGYVVEVIPDLVCWLDSRGQDGVHRFEVREDTSAGALTHVLDVSWSIAELEKHDPRLKADLARYRARQTLRLEDRAKMAAYGLAMIAISCILKRRVVDVSYYRAPDLLLDTTPSALRGVEVAGRSGNGYAGLKQIMDGSSGKNPRIGKRAQLLEMQDVVEAYLSLWCCDPKVSFWVKVKP